MEESDLGSEYQPASGLCAAESVAPKEIDHLVPIEGGYFIAGDNGPCVFTTRLTLAPPPDADCPAR